MRVYDVVIIGGGPAGLAAASEIYKQGIEDILVVERSNTLGGILQQCIHNGFGLHEFGEQLSGPEYAQRFIDEITELGIEYRLNTMVLDVNRDKEIHMISSEGGYQTIRAKSIVLAMGCRERTRGAISIPGTRPAGVITAGAAQYYLNIKGYLVGKKVFILGSGDIGLIMARRMTLEGAEVLGVAEVLPYSGGLTRNIVQCLEDYEIPLYLSHTVVEVKGKERVEGVVIAKVDENRKPIHGTEMEFDVDTLLLSVGLIPENELSEKLGVELHEKTNGAIVNELMETSIEGVFACGNVLHVHDLVDFVSAESRKAGLGVVKYLREETKKTKGIKTCNGSGVGYVVPHSINVDNIEDEYAELFLRSVKAYEDVELIIREGDRIIKSMKKSHLAPAEMENIKVKKELLKGAREIVVEIKEKNFKDDSLVCIVCPKGCRLHVTRKNDEYIVSGNQCKRGETYAIKELSNPTRVLTTTVKVQGSDTKRLPVMTKGEVPKTRIFEAMELLNQVTVEPPINVGEIIIEDLLELGINVTASRTI